MPWSSSIVPSEILAVHAALVPSGSQGEVVLFGGDEHWIDQQEPGGDFRKTRLYDVASHSLVNRNIPSPDSDVFCAHHVFARDGRLLIVGGTQKWPEEHDGHEHGLDYLGHRRCWLYNHEQRAWTEVTRLNPDPAQPDAEHSGGRWYPGTYTLGNGDVLAIFGHPDQQDSRHRNTLPERYNQAGNYWMDLPKVMGMHGHPNEGGRRYLFFPRGWVMPDGKLFFATPMPAEFTTAVEGPHFSTAYDPISGNYTSPKIGAPNDTLLGTGLGGDYNDWNRPAVLLPILPEESYRMRFMHVGSVVPISLDLGETNPAWKATSANRHSSVINRNRLYSNAVLLPTGEVCVVGGVHQMRPEDPVLETELYDPGIDWGNGDYSGNDAWRVDGNATHARNYHSTALLLPNGKVWVAGGNTNAQNGNPEANAIADINGVVKPIGIKEIELYEPPYISVTNRIEVTNAPGMLGYGETFEITIDRAASNVRNVALIRNGSVTHSTNTDQRFVGLSINQTSGNTLTLSAPPNGNVAPPGHYMLWVIDDSGRPCELAPFVRLAHVNCNIVTDRSTFSEEEVQALGGGGQATFTNAIYVHYDGFIHTELTGSPTFELRWADNNSIIPSNQITLVPAGRLQEIEPGFADTAQRITFPFHVRFLNDNVYQSFTDRREIKLVFRLGDLRCSQTLELTKSPNPYMIDIAPGENNPAWLSTDVRVFHIEAGQGRFSQVLNPNQPLTFIRNCLDELNHPNNNGEALFNDLSTSTKLNLATLADSGAQIHNFAIAKVRYRATTTTAQRVKCFFRMFNVANTGLAFNRNTTYRRTEPPASAVPLIGKAGGEVVSIPFFANHRVETVQGRSGATSMENQTLNTNYEILDIVPNSSGAEVTVFFGCWLDINQTVKRFPISPGNIDGPWPEASCRSIQELVRGEHMCMVAEVFFNPDPTKPGATPGQSDNLSQRNLAILNSDNPGGPDSHTVMHTFEVKPSRLPKLSVHDARLAITTAQETALAKSQITRQAQQIAKTEAKKKVLNAKPAREELQEAALGILKEFAPVNALKAIADIADVALDDMYEMDDIEDMDVKEAQEAEQKPIKPMLAVDPALPTKHKPMATGFGVYEDDVMPRYGVDELIFRWHNLPRGSKVKVTFSDIDTQEIQLLASLRRSPIAFEVIDRHTLGFTVAGATWVPIPGGREKNIPALLSIELPDNVVYGKVYRVSLHQVDGLTKRIQGSCEFKIEVSKAELIVRETARNLSVMKHIANTIPTENRWYPLFTRYVHHMGLKLNALGGDAKDVHANPDGSGRPYDPQTPDDWQTPDPLDDGRDDPDNPGYFDTQDTDGDFTYIPGASGTTDRETGGTNSKYPDRRGKFKGYVSDIIYDCHGKFRGFILDSCKSQRSFEGCSGRFEKLIKEACENQTMITVHAMGRKIVGVQQHCC